MYLRNHILEKDNHDTNYPCVILELAVCSILNISDIRRPYILDIIMLNDYHALHKFHHMPTCERVAKLSRRNSNLCDLYV